MHFNGCTVIGTLSGEKGKNLCSRQKQLLTPVQQPDPKLQKDTKAVTSSQACRTVASISTCF